MRKILFLTALFCVPLFSASNDDPVGKDFVVTAVRTTSPIEIDGLLNEEVWHNGNSITRFTQRDPNEGRQASEKSEVRVAYDDQALYVSAKLYDSCPDSIEARLGRRDSYDSADLFGFFVDPYYDKRSGYYFGLSAGGTFLDGVLMNDDWDDESWDGVWDGRARVTDDGWIVEIRVPFSQLRFKEQSEYVWGINFRRDIPRRNEEDYLVYTPKNGSGFVSRFPKLVGLKDIHPANNIEILPYVRAKGEFTHPDKEDPFNDGSRYLPGMGVDLKYGISSNLTLNATVNPDFGQVEVDPAVVNLSDVETFFDEKRPFFVEGSSIFDFGSGGATNQWGFNWSGPDFFYSRRLGRAPQGTSSLPDYDFINIPEGTEILGAAKITGKLGKDWNIGAIHGITAREYADLEKNGRKFTEEIEPLTHYSVLRVQREINEGYRGIGIISTGAIRDFKDKRLKNEVNSKALAFGLDGWTFLDKNRTWVITGWGGMSHIEGNKTRITDLQKESQHYFQRPDAKVTSLDTNATKLQGFAARLLVNKQKGNVIFNSAIGVIDPGFDVRDVGFMWRTNVINAHIGGGYKWTKPGKISRYTELIGALFQTRDFDGNTTWQGIFGLFSTQFLNYYSFEMVTAYDPMTYNIYGTRGGPIMVNKPGFEIDLELQSDDRKPWVFELDFNSYVHSTGEYDRGTDFEIQWKALDNLSVSLNPGIEWTKDYSQWIDDFEDVTATKTYGKRYVFANLDYTEVSSSIRLNWTFTPKLSLQLYMQPLIASAKFTKYKYLDRPKSYAFNEFGEGSSTLQIEDETIFADADGDGPAPELEWEKRDFNEKSLRGNAVLRWEYLPGSTLYFVWTQTRSRSDQTGNFEFGRSVDRLLDTQADNIFMIKMTYWLNF